MKNVLIFGGIILILFVLMFVFSNLGEESFDVPSEAPTPAEVWEDDWTKGNPEAEVVLVEYSDFECPACGSYFPLLSQLVDIFEDDILFVYRHFPLEQHPNAHLAARASEAAGRQGMFWEMHDEIFERQNQWRGRNARPFFMEYADSLGLNMEEFRADIDSPEIGEKVNRDRQSGFEARVSGTPSFFINGERIDNPPGLEAFVALIESYLDEDLDQLDDQLDEMDESTDEVEEELDEDENEEE